MSEYISWIFDGIGTEIVSIVASLLIGGLGGFLIGKRSAIKQFQKADNNAIQNQSSILSNKADSINNSQESIVVSQSQKAKDNANQVQIGSVKDE